jgi:hypothetical protein
MKTKIGVLLTLLALIGLVFGMNSAASAAIPAPGDQQGGTVGVEGTISSDPPTQNATIVTPANGQSFSTIPITVSGFCPTDTLVKVFANNIFVGSSDCVRNSYSLQVALFSGRNDLVAKVFDALDQQGPDSGVVTVNFNDAQFAQFGSHVLITSQYARRAAAPDTDLEWPVVISSGLGPYALSVDWADGTPAHLQSVPFAGIVTLKHTYKTPGVYRVTFKVVDTNGTTGFLQVVAVVTGPTQGSLSQTSGKAQKTIVIQKELLWWPMAILIVPILLSFWLGRRYELAALRKRLERDYDQ